MKQIKVTDKVTIKKPGHLTDGMQGEVISNAPECSKPLKVDLGACGVWQLSYDEIHQPNKEKATEGVKMVWENEEDKKMADSINSIFEASGSNKEKRSYNRKPKDEPVKQKRKYEKKIKS